MNDFKNTPDQDLPGIDLIVNAFLREHLPERTDLLEWNSNDGERLRRSLKRYSSSMILFNREQLLDQIVDMLRNMKEKIG